MTLGMSRDISYSGRATPENYTLRWGSRARARAYGVNSGRWGVPLFLSGVSKLWGEFEVSRRGIYAGARLLMCQRDIYSWSLVLRRVFRGTVMAIIKMQIIGN